VARRRQIVLFREGARAGESEPLGSVGELARLCAGYNIAPDGSGPEGYGEALGMAMFYGPGLVMEVPNTGEDARQAIVTLTDEDFAWAVLGKMCKHEKLKMMDPETGRTFG